MSWYRPAPGQVLHSGPGGEDPPWQGRHWHPPHLHPQEGQVCRPGDGEGDLYYLYLEGVIFDHACELDNIQQLKISCSVCGQGSVSGSGHPGQDCGPPLLLLEAAPVSHAPTQTRSDLEPTFSLHLYYSIRICLHRNGHVCILNIAAISSHDLPVDSGKLQASGDSGEVSAAAVPLPLHSLQDVEFNLWTIISVLYEEQRRKMLHSTEREGWQNKQSWLYFYWKCTPFQ